MKRFPLYIALAIPVLLSVPARSTAQLTVANIFSDNMVLQRDTGIRVWGMAPEGTEVEVALAGKTAVATAGSESGWTALLPAFPAGGPYSLTVRTGDEKIVFDNILTGDVWFASGQSNMEHPMRGWSWIPGSAVRDFENELRYTDVPHIRLCSIARCPCPVVPDEIPTGGWKTADSVSVAEFSSTAWFFAKYLHENTGVPVGIIHSSWGGTPIEAWMSRESLEKFPEVRLPETPEDFDYATWQEKMYAADTAYIKWRIRLLDHRQEVEQSQPQTYYTVPTYQYNGRVAPLTKYKIKGFIWFQGESNVGQPALYGRMFRELITGWRNEWGQGNLPFLFVQLSFYLPESGTETTGFADLRDAQASVLDLPATGMAVSIDLGEAYDIHFKNKKPVGERLARQALKIAYKSDMAEDGPDR